MNKKEFIKLLEHKLAILEETELKDIINEYKDIIDEKVKHGKTEEEAVAEFGSVDELAKEILKAYKINPKYGETKDQVKETLDNCEDLIKKGAKKLSIFTKEVIEDIKDEKESLSIELIFEIIIKFIILLVLFAILRLPFELINHLGQSILDIAFFPLDKILIVFWQLAIFILYFVSCLLIFMAMFKEYFKNPSKNNKETKKEKKETKEEKINDVSKTVEVKESKKKDREINSGALTRVLLVMIKVFITIFILIPLMFVNIGLFVALGISIYYLCIGIDTVGLVVLLIGMGTVSSYLQDVFYNMAYRTKKVYFFPFMIGVVLSIIGGLLLFNTAINMDYQDKVPNNELKTELKRYNLTITDKTEIITSNSEVTYKTNEELANGDIMINVIYYSDLLTVGDSLELSNGDESDYIAIVQNYNNYRKNNIKLYNIFIDNLKENEIYNYNRFYQLNIEVSANAETMNLLK